MSRKRYISTDISTDTKVAELSETGLLPVLIFTWAVPHMDDWGRITGDPREFKLLVCPGLDVSSREVDEAINSIVDIGLWKRYTVDGKRCISVAHKENWFKHQSYISKDKRENDGGSTFPPPPQNTEELRETPKNAEEAQEIPQNPVSFSLSSSVSYSPSNNTTATTMNPFRFFESEGFGTISSVISDKLGDMVDTYSERWVIEAMREAVVHGVRKLSYVDGILKRYQSSGIDEPWTAEKPKQLQKVVNHPTRSSKPQKPNMPIYQAPSGKLEGEEKEELARVLKYLEEGA